MNRNALRFTLLSAGLPLLFAATLAALPPGGDDSSECLDCHEFDRGVFAGFAHVGSRGGHERVSCLSCHVGFDDEHPDTDEDDGETAKVEPSVCLGCHPGLHQANIHERDPHGDAGLDCTACHGVHGTQHTRLLRDEEPELCLDCHGSVAVDFARPFRHPVRDRVVRCSDCHLSLSQERRQGVYAGSSTACVTCHGRMRGPFPFEHQAVVDYSAQEGGCLNCHEAHGGDHPRMLKQPYEPGNVALCNQCHSVPAGHRQNSFHGSTWDGVPCSDCHVDIHGSYENRQLLDPGLRVQGCTAPGCHEF